MSKQAKIKHHMLRSSWSKEAIDFVNKLIQRKRGIRLGENGICELKNHPWLSRFPWQYLESRQIQPRFVPENKNDNFDYRNVNKKFFEKAFESKELLKDESFQKVFEQYQYKGRIKE